MINVNVWRKTQYENLMPFLLFFTALKKEKRTSTRTSRRRPPLCRRFLDSLTRATRSNGKESYPGHTSSITHKNEKTDIISTSSLATSFISPVTIIIHSSSSSFLLSSPLSSLFPFPSFFHIKNLTHINYTLTMMLKY